MDIVIVKRDSSRRAELLLRYVFVFATVSYVYIRYIRHMYVYYIYTNEMIACAYMRLCATDESRVAESRLVGAKQMN